MGEYKIHGVYEDKNRKDSMFWKMEPNETGGVDINLVKEDGTIRFYVASFTKSGGTIYGGLPAEVRLYVKNLEDKKGEVF